MKTNKSHSIKVTAQTKSTKYNKLMKAALPLFGLGILSFIAADSALATDATDVVELPFVDKLSATVKEYMNGVGAIVIDGIILLGGGYGAAKTSSPAPLIFAVLSVMLFHICLKVFL